MPQRRQRPKLGQNFLVSPGAQAAIADALGNPESRTVVEIGPGRGAITHMLAARARRLIAIELDRELAPKLRESFAGRPGVEVLEQDVLETDFRALRRQDEDRLLVVGNLPYYITSDILLRLFEFWREVDQAVIMIQREVAERVAAMPGTRDYGLLSATAQLYAKVEMLFTLPPEAFSPPPQVYSTVLRLTMAPRFEELDVDPGGFVGFLRTAFAQKRKMLGKNLRTAGYEGSAVGSALESCGIDPQVRAEEVDLDRMAALYRQLSKA